MLHKLSLTARVKTKTYFAKISFHFDFRNFRSFFLSHLALFPVTFLHFFLSNSYFFLIKFFQFFFRFLLWHLALILVTFLHFCWWHSCIFSWDNMHFLTHSCTFSSDIVALLKNIFFNDILALLIVTFCTYSGDIQFKKKV